MSNLNNTNPAMTNSSFQRKLDPEKVKSLYKTTSSDYGGKWLLLEAGATLVNSEIPNYERIGQSIPEFRRREKLLKNETVTRQFSESKNEELDEITAARLKLDQNALRAKKFPVPAGAYKYPEHGLNIGSPLYMTSYMDIGKLLPTSFEIPEKFNPRDTTFTKGFGGQVFHFNGLNTATNFSKVHKQLDEF